MAIEYYDAARSMGNALAGAAAFNQMREQKDLRNFLAQNSGALMSGDPAALGAYAQYDPGGAFTMRRQMDADARAKAAEGRAVAAAGRDEQLFQKQMEQYAAQMSAREAEVEQMQTRRAIQILSMADAPDKWDALVGGLVQSGDIPEDEAQALVGQFDNRETIIRGAMTWDQFLEERKGKDPADEYGRYVEEEIAAGREPLSRIDFKRAGQKSMRVRTSADGSTTVEEVFGGEGVPDLTVDAAKNTGFLIRTRESNAILDEFDRQGTDFWQTLANDKGGRLGNYALTPEFQKFDQAKRDFVNAILRRESGAVISDEEFANANKQYFPVPGDSDEVIAQKRQNRRTAIEGLRVGSGAGAAYVEGQPTAAADGGGSQAQTDQAVDLQGADLELFGKYGVPIGQ